MHHSEISPVMPCDFSATPPPKRLLEVMWMHDTARLTGGCEHYMVNCVRRLRSHGIRSTLLYGESGSGPLDMLLEFDRAFPIVDLPKQLQTIDPDVIYAHRIAGCDVIDTLTRSGIPTLRFFHDHKLFCPREHKYTVLGKTTCVRTIGIDCYSCLGVLNRSSSWPGISIRSVGALKQEQRAHYPMDGFVVGSHYMANHLIDHGFSPAKIHVLPLFADPPETITPTIRDPNLLLFVGQIVRGKGLDILLRAISKTPAQVRLVVVGSGAQEGEARRLTEKAGLESRVAFVGKKSQTELAALYSQAGCLVVPSRSPETFGQVGIEAMSYGLPAIAANVGGITEWLKESENGLLCEPNSSDSLAETICEFTSSAGLQQRLAVNAEKIYRAQFQPANHIDALASLLQSTSRSAVQ